MRAPTRTFGGVVGRLRLPSSCNDAPRPGALARAPRQEDSPVSKVRVSCFGVSLDGFGAGTDQSLEHPLGVLGPELMEWFFSTHVWKSMHQLGEGEKGVDNGMAAQGMDGIGAGILERKMSCPHRRPMPDK